MHYHNPPEMPKYLFGERAPLASNKSTKNDEIFLNKSGWVQVNQESRGNRNEVKYEVPSYSKPKQMTDDRSKAQMKFSTKNSSKIEAMISRSGARDQKTAERIKYTIDPQVSVLLNERPGSLAVKRFTDNESPPPITPIISPPPAFQDTDVQRPTVITAEPHNKGMVFSRSFDYDTRKSFEYNQTFSKSFDYDFVSPVKDERHLPKERLNVNFTSLTGVSPNYLTKKPTAMTMNVGGQRDAGGIYQQFLEPKTYAEPNAGARSRVRTRPGLRTEAVKRMEPPTGRGQFVKEAAGQGFRSQQFTVNKRLNSCDSGNRSGEYRTDRKLGFR